MSLFIGNTTDKNRITRYTKKNNNSISFSPIEAESNDEGYRNYHYNSHADDDIQFFLLTKK